MKSNPFDPSPSFEFHPAVLKAIASGRMRLELNGKDVAPELAPECVITDRIEHRTTTFVDQLTVFVISVSKFRDPVVEFMLLPVLGRRPMPSPSIDASLTVELGGESFTARAVGAQGQCMAPIRARFNTELGVVDWSQVEQWHETRHVPAYQNQVGVGDYFSIDHRADTRTLSYWIKELDAYAFRPMHFIHESGRILEESDVPDLVFHGAWPHENSRGYNTQNWINLPHPPWKARTTTSQYRSRWTNPDFQHLSWDALCQGYIAHEDPIHGLLIEFAAQNYLRSVAPFDNGKGTSANNPGTPRARARVLKAAMNLWFALNRLIARPGLFPHRRQALESLRRNLEVRFGGRLHAATADVADAIRHGEKDWVIRGGRGIISPQEHALFAGTLSFLQKSARVLNADLPEHIDGLRAAISRWVLDRFDHVQENGNWTDAAGHRHWAIPYELDAETKARSHPTEGGWIFTIEMLEAMKDDPLPEDAREKLASILGELAPLPQAEDWRTPEFINLPWGEAPQKTNK